MESCLQSRRSYTLNFWYPRPTGEYKAWIDILALYVYISPYFDFAYLPHRLQQVSSLMVVTCPIELETSLPTIAIPTANPHRWRWVAYFMSKSPPNRNVIGTRKQAINVYPSVHTLLVGTTIWCQYHCWRCGREWAPIIHNWTKWYLIRACIAFCLRDIVTIKRFRAITGRLLVKAVSSPRPKLRSSNFQNFQHVKQ